MPVPAWASASFVLRASSFVLRASSFALACVFICDWVHAPFASQRGLYLHLGAGFIFSSVRVPFAPRCWHQGAGFICAWMHWLNLHLHLDAGPVCFSVWLLFTLGCELHLRPGLDSICI